MSVQLKKNSDSRQFFESLDGIRGLAAILVAIYHLNMFFGPQRFQESYLAVDIFFVLSGVVIANAYEEHLLSGLTARRFFLIRIIRIYPLYTLGCVIAAISIIAGFGLKMETSQLLLSTGLALFILPNPFMDYTHSFPLNGPSWSLFFELLANFVYAALIRYWDAFKLFVVMGISAVGLTLGIHFGHTHSVEFGWTLKGFPFGVFRVGYSFFAGVLVYRFYNERHPAAKGCPLRGNFAPLLILGVVAFFLIFTPTDEMRPFYDFFAVVAVFPAVIYAAMFVEPTGYTAVVFKFMGGISFALYALHMPIGLLVQNALMHFGGIAIDDYAPISGIAIMLALFLICWVIDKIYDVPVRRLLISRM